MSIFKQYRNLWMMGIIVVLAILFITNFNHVVNGIMAVCHAFTPLFYGAMVAFILNLIMDPVERWLKKSHMPLLAKHSRSIAILVAFLIISIIIVLILSIIIPNMVSAFRVLTSEAPQYFKELEDFIDKLLVKYPSLQDSLGPMTVNWNETIDKVLMFISKGIFGGNSTSGQDAALNIVNSMMGGVINLFVIVIFSIYVLSQKERFVKAYYVLTSIYMSKRKAGHLTKNLRITNECFRSFVGGELIEACILSTMCIIGMMILRLPYALMIGILVGVINMIPMFGAYIGGAIGAFIIFTISPVKCLVFVIFLCIIQQIESQVFFPRVIGNRVGLPGIFVMMTIVVGGSLFGVFGMILGVPLMAAVYKIALEYFKEKKERIESGEDHRPLDESEKRKTAPRGSVREQADTSAAEEMRQEPFIARLHQLRAQKKKGAAVEAVPDVKTEPLSETDTNLAQDESTAV